MPPRQMIAQQDAGCDASFLAVNSHAEEHNSELLALRLAAYKKNMRVFEGVVSVAAPALLLWQLTRVLECCTDDRCFLSNFQELPDVQTAATHLTVLSIQAGCWGMVLPDIGVQLAQRLFFWRESRSLVSLRSQFEDGVNDIRQSANREETLIYPPSLVCYIPLCLYILNKYHKSCDIPLVNEDIPFDLDYFPLHDLGLTQNPTVGSLNVAFPITLCWMSLLLLLSVAKLIKNIAIACNTEKWYQKMTSEQRFDGEGKKVVPTLFRDSFSMTFFALVASFMPLVFVFLSTPSELASKLSYLQQLGKLVQLKSAEEVFDPLQLSGNVNGTWCSNHTFALQNVWYNETCLSNVTFINPVRLGSRSQCLFGVLSGSREIENVSFIVGLMLNGLQLFFPIAGLPPWELCNTAQELAQLELTVFYMYAGLLILVSVTLLAIVSQETYKKLFSVIDPWMSRVGQHMAKYKLTTFVVLFLLSGTMTDILDPPEEASSRFTVFGNGVALLFGGTGNDSHILPLAWQVAVCWFEFLCLLWLDGCCIFCSVVFKKEEECEEKEEEEEDEDEGERDRTLSGNYVVGGPVRDTFNMWSDGIQGNILPSDTETDTAKKSLLGRPRRISHP